MSKYFQVEWWQEQIKACKKSGMKETDWCKTQGIDYRVYYHWKKRLEDYPVVQENSSDQEHLQKDDGEATFVELAMPQSRDDPDHSPCRLSITTSAEDRSHPAAVIRKGSVLVEIYPNASESIVHQLMEVML